MFQALRNRSIALLWCGQSLSAIGDEIYRVALLWLAIQLIGTDTGYLAATQYFSVLTLSLIGGKWADGWDHRKTMIWVDALRAGIVLIPVVVNHFHPVPLVVFWLVAISISGLGAFFDPALQATLPRFTTDLKTLRSATGLMSTTARMARVVGPGIISVLTPFLPTIQFFTLDAVTFAISALSIHATPLPLERREAPRSSRRMGFRETIVSAFQEVRHEREMRFYFFSKSIMAGLWNLAYGLGFALLAHQIAPKDARAFGMIIAAYGAGNFGGTLVLGSLSRKMPARIMFCGFIWIGIGFIATAVAPQMATLLIAAAFAGIGGPMNDLPFTDLAQDRYPISELPKIFRLKMAGETAVTLVCMLAAPVLFRVLPIQSVIAICGAVMILAGIVGLLRYSERSGAMT